MKRLYLFSFILIASLLLSSCANYKLNYQKDQKQWETLQPNPGLKKVHTMFLIGDAGNSETPTLPLQLLDKKLKEAGENSSVLFLGDNIYPGGMPPKGEKEVRAEAERKLLNQLEIVKDFEGRPIFVPGNHDTWYYKTKGVKRQEEFVEEYMDKYRDEDMDYFIPDDGCSGPEVEELTDDLVVIAFNTQWWLMDWDKDPDINYGCEAKTREYANFLFEELVRKHRSKNIVVAVHHPMYSYGPHGGAFTFKQHVFPLTELEDNLYIPLPGLGTTAAFIRSVVGLRQDLANPLYKEMRTKLLGSTRKNGKFIFVSGHEHNLQYIVRDSQHFIVSGAGSKNNPVRLGKGSQFAYGKKGFSQLDFYEDGSVWLQFWAANEDYPQGEVVFRKKIKGELPRAEDLDPEQFTQYEERKSTVDTFVTDRKFVKKGPFLKLIQGKLHRDIYEPKYAFEVLDLDDFAGGMSVVKRGGGGQTNSLRLEDPQERQFVMRSMTKDASRAIPYPFNKITTAKEIFEDNFMSAHPFAAIALPPLADAVNVYHTNPELYYIPRQPALTGHNDAYGGEVYMLEERPNGDWKGYPSFGGGDDFHSTLDVIEEMHKNTKHIPDQSWVARSRLFDLVIGDWDRHDDQWRWAEFEINDDSIVYRPIPRDRDQTFCRYDGAISGIARLTMPFLKQLRTYKPEIGNIKWSTYNGRRLDRTFLNKLPWEKWKQEAEFIQKNLTDESIEKALALWPKQLQQHKSTDHIRKTLKYRRDHLVETARKHYENLAKAVEIVGTNDRELFKVERLNNEETVVSVYDMSDKKGKIENKTYERRFFTKETKEIRLFGLEDDDRFEISGEVDKGILIRAIGGEGEDFFEDRSHVSGWSKKTKIYDTPDENELILGKEAKDKTSKRSELNQYHRRDFYHEYNFAMPFPLIGFNPDDGLFLGGQVKFVNYKFKKVPYANSHTISGQYAFATGAYDFRYSGEFITAIKSWDLLLDAHFQGPKFVINYFGLGNETQNTMPDNFDFNRIRQQLIGVYPAIRRRLIGDVGHLSLSPLFERVIIEDTPGRFISSEDANVPNRVFDTNYYGGLSLEFNYDNVNSPQIPSRGIKFESSLAWRANLEETDRQFTGLRSALSIYQNLTPNEVLIFATRIGVGHNIGASNSFEFFQAPRLGGNSNLRGFRAQRFYGKTSFFHQTDLRLKLFSTENNFLPFSFGLTGGFDYGRVWLNEEDSDTWHYGYGGGVWIAPIDYFVILGDFFVSDEDERLMIRLGFAF